MECLPTGFVGLSSNDNPAREFSWPAECTCAIIRLYWPVKRRSNVPRVYWLSGGFVVLVLEVFDC